MENTFENLVEKFGVPKIIMPNTPRLRFFGDYNGVSNNPDLEIEGTIYHRRYRYGETEFITVKSRIEAYKCDEEKLLESLKKQNLKPVDFFYRYKDTHAWNYSTGDWRNDKVSISTDADVEPLSREDLLKSIGEERVLWIVGWSSMGDKYVDFHICSAEFLPKDEGFHLLFEKSLESEMLVDLGYIYDYESEFFNSNSHYFTSEFFSDK